MKFSVLLWATLHALLVGIVIVGLSIPIISSLHSHFDLGTPSVGGLIYLCLGVVGVFIGAALLGAILGMLRGQRASGAMAAFIGFVWSFFLVAGLSTTYSRQIGQTALQKASLVADENRLRIQQNIQETEEQEQAGHASRDATLSALKLSDEISDASIAGTAKLPAMSLLVWAILLGPALCAFECRRARE